MCSRSKFLAENSLRSCVWIGSHFGAVPTLVATRMARSSSSCQMCSRSPRCQLGNTGSATRCAIRASCDAFAAIVVDGSVILRGSADPGGSSTGTLRCRLSAVQYRISRAMCSRSQLLISQLLQLQPTLLVQWSHEVRPTLAATAVQYRISGELCSRYELLVLPLLQSSLLDQW